MNYRLGTVTVPLEDVYEKQNLERIYPIFKREGSSESSLHLKLHFTPSEPNENQTLRKYSKYYDLVYSFDDDSRSFSESGVLRRGRRAS